MGKTLIGGELRFSGYSADGSDDCVNPAFSCNVEIKNTKSLVLRAGRLLSDDLLVYGAAGVAKADVYAFTEIGGTEFGETKSLSGYNVGLGLEKALGKRTRLRGEVMYYDFGGADFATDGGLIYQDISTSFTQVGVGVVVNF